LKALTNKLLKHEHVREIYRASVYAERRQQQQWQVKSSREKMVVTVASVRQQLSNLAHSGGSHKDQAEKYVECNRVPIPLHIHERTVLCLDTVQPWT